MVALQSGRQTLEAGGLCMAISSCPVYALGQHQHQVDEQVKSTRRRVDGALLKYSSAPVAADVEDDQV
jgi:hypothetical protein